MVDVLETNQHDLASKKQLHITIAYHHSQDLLDHIVETTKRWIGSLTIYQKTPSLRRWGGRSDIIEGPFSIQVENFRRVTGLTLPN